MVPTVCLVGAIKPHLLLAFKSIHDHSVMWCDESVILRNVPFRTCTVFEKLNSISNVWLCHFYWSENSWRFVNHWHSHPSRFKVFLASGTAKEAASCSNAPLLKEVDVKLGGEKKSVSNVCSTVTNTDGEGSSRMCCFSFPSFHC